MADRAVVAELLGAASFEITQAMEAMLGHLAAVTGVPSHLLVAFDAVRTRGARRVGDVADATGTSASAASRSVDGLVEAGLLDRVRDAEDRRSQVLTVTDRGDAWAERLDEHVTDILLRATDGYDDDEVRGIIDLLTDLSHGIRDAVADQSGDASDGRRGDLRVAPGAHDG